MKTKYFLYSLYFFFFSSCILVLRKMFLWSFAFQCLILYWLVQLCLVFETLLIATYGIWIKEEGTGLEGYVYNYVDHFCRELKAFLSLLHSTIRFLLQMFIFIFTLSFSDIDERMFLKTEWIYKKNFSLSTVVWKVDNKIYSLSTLHIVNLKSFYK